MPSANPTDFYQVLGVPRDATPGQIKNAYEKKKQELQTQQDPDLQDPNITDEERKRLERQRKKMTEMIDEAVKILMDLPSRQQYDQTLQQRSMQVSNPQAANNPTAQNATPSNSAKAGAQFVLNVDGKDLQEVMNHLQQYTDSKNAVLQLNNTQLTEAQQHKLEMGGQLIQATMTGNALQITFPNSYSMNEFSSQMQNKNVLSDVRPKPGMVRDLKEEKAEELQQKKEQSQANTDTASSTVNSPGATPKLVPPGAK